MDTGVCIRKDALHVLTTTLSKGGQCIENNCIDYNVSTDTNIGMSAFKYLFQMDSCPQLMGELFKHKDLLVLKILP